MEFRLHYTQLDQRVGQFGWCGESSYSPASGPQNGASAAVPALRGLETFTDLLSPECLMKDAERFGFLPRPVRLTGIQAKGCLF